MPVAAEEWISKPLEVIRKLHDERIVESGGGDGDSVVRDYFTELLHSNETLNKIPSLNTTPLEVLPDGCLVRYRGMIQDQFNPELYLKQYTAVNPTTGHTLKYCGMYRDLIDLPAGYSVVGESPDNVTGDRHTLYLVPIPTQTEWVRDYERESSSVGHCESSHPELRTGTKRSLEEEEEEGEMEVVNGGGEKEEGGPGTKRAREEEEGAGGGSGVQTAGTGPDLNYPLPGETGLPCLLKVYGGSVETLSVTSAVECVGVLGKHPLLAHFEEEDGGAEEGMVAELSAERSAHSPPPSLVPRLHCILVTSLPHTNPLLPQNLSLPLPGEVYEEKFGGVAKSRDLLLSLLTSALYGDSLAAEFTLLHLLSSVHGRTNVMALGKFSLNITNCPPTTPPSSSSSSSSSTLSPLAPTLNSLLSQLVTQSLLLPLSLEVMNSWKLTPRKDYTTNRLAAGALQLVRGTHLLVDETALEPGRLSEVGVQNLAALGHVIQQQTVTYDFQFHKTEFECDLPVMVLTEGKKSILKVDCVVPLTPSSSPPPPPPPTPPPTREELNQVRVYLTLHRMLDYSLSPDVQKAVEEDFVVMRRTDKSMTADKFHYLLCLARLVSLSYGCSQLSTVHWNHAKHLETERMKRAQTMSSA